MFLSYVSGTDTLLLPMESISDDEILFTRTVGSFDGNTYGTVTNYLVKVSSEDVYTFHSSTVGEEQVQSDWAQTNNQAVDYIKNKPNLAEVATSGSYNDLSDKPSIPAAQVQSDWEQSDSSAVDYIKNKPSLSEVATSGDYEDLTNKPTIPAAQVQSDWAQTNSSSVDFIKNKPNLASVATSGDYDDLSNKPSIPAAQVQSDWNQSNSSAVDYIKNKPNLASVATSGSYNDLSDKPSIPSGQVQSDWAQTNTQAVDYIKNKPNLATVATSGSYNDLSNKPTIPAAQVQSDWNQSNSSAVDYIKNKPNLSTVATTGDYDDLSNKPTIPAPQVQSDWAQTNTQAVDYIKNKPSIPSAQVQSDWTEADTSDPSYIQNKPNLAAVATSGDYDDLSNKPTIPAAQVQSDWAQTDNTKVDYIKNKPAAMETKPLVAGTNIEFVSAADRVTINSSGTKIVKRSNLYSSEVPVTEMTVYDPNEDYGALLRDQNDATIGYLAPKHYGNNDEGKVLTVVNDNGYKLEWRPQSGGSSDLKLLTETTQNVDSGTGAYQLTVVDGYAYTLNMLVDREVQLITNSTETVHTRIAIHNNGDSTCGGCYLTWRDEALVQHRIYLMLYNVSSSVEYFFDVYIKRVIVNGTPYAIARVTDFPCAYRDGYTNGYSTDNINFIGRDY